MTGPKARRVAVAAVGLLTGVPIAVGFVVSWGALRDSALAAHTAPTAARLYPLGVDGLIAMALVAALVLRHERPARRYCLGVLAAFTASSLVLNIAHGQGAIVPGKPLAWQLATLVSAQAVAAIGFGCHLLVHVLRAWFPTLGAVTAHRPAVRRTAAVRPEARPTSASSTATAATKAPLGAGAGNPTRHRGDSSQPASNGGSGTNGKVSATPAARHLRHTGTPPAPANDAAPGSKTAAILQYRQQVLTAEGREPSSKEIAKATPASERMARKVLAELRASGPATDSSAADAIGNEVAELAEDSLRVEAS
jgi:hypothetical protein